MVWEPADTVGLISLIAGVVLLIIPLPRSLAALIWLCGGGACVAMGIGAVANDSKLGIGGIIAGGLLVFVGIMTLL